ncbi:aromatic-ring hydroxylase C-terminal domain-containing protein [Streptomyces sp. NBC_00557]|uniref:aromatic-ring hydroxylase C-terminal domain-containing protein n=1 Tax=Streptomyces sp. NBC_00557 TaxID=2975776 RepID=UPI003FCE251B
MALSGGRFVLIAPEPYEAGPGRADRLTVAHWASDRRTTALVRPDGYAAWAADAAGAADTETALTAHVGV